MTTPVRRLAGALPAVSSLVMLSLLLQALGTGLAPGASGLAPGTAGGATMGLAPGAGGVALPAAPAAPATPFVPSVPTPVPGPFTPNRLAPTGTLPNGAPVTGVPLLPPRPPRPGAAR